MKWKVAVPSGLSSPIVVGDKLVITAFENDKLYTIAYNRADGSEAWRAEAPVQKSSLQQSQGSPAASTCATDGERIVSYFGSCGLFCYDLAGNELWKYEMPTAETIAGFGTGVSPIIADGMVILMREEAKDPKIVALDLATGKPKWEKKRESKSSFGTPAVWNTPNGKQIVAPGYGKMIGYNLKNGDEEWYVEGMPSACCTTPVTGDGNLFFAGWSPGDPDDKDFKMPTFDDMLKDDTDKDGTLSKEEAEKTDFKDLFDNQDANKDGKLTRDEWDAVAKFAANSRSSAFALKPGGTGDVTESGCAVEADERPAVCVVGDSLPRPIRDGEGRRHGHGLRREDGQAALPEAACGNRQLLRVAGGRERKHLLRVARRWHDDGPRRRHCRSQKSWPRIRRSANAWRPRRRSPTTRCTCGPRNTCTRLPHKSNWKWGGWSGGRRGDRALSRTRGSPVARPQPPKSAGV